MRHRITRNEAGKAALSHRLDRSDVARPEPPPDAKATTPPLGGSFDPGAAPAGPANLDQSRPAIPPRDLTTSRYGLVGRLIKWAMSLLLSYHTYHQDLVNASLAASIEQIAGQQARLANELLDQDPVEARLAALERQIELVRGRLQRIGATLREHDQRVDDLGFLLEHVGRTPPDHHESAPPDGDPVVSFSLPPSNGHATDLDRVDGHPVRALRWSSDATESRVTASRGGLEALADGIHQAISSVRALQRQIDDVSGEAARIQRIPTRRSIRSSRPATRRPRRNRPPSA